MGDLVTVFGGTGFLGRRIVSSLLGQGFRVRIATRHPTGHDGDPLAESVRADVSDDRSVAAAVADSFGVVNAVSLYVERDGHTFRSVHVDAAARVAIRARQAGVARLAHVSGIGSDARSESAYIRSRGQGEQAVTEAFPDVVLIRPAVMFGPDDALVVPISRLLRRLPVFALFGAGRTRLQPAWVDDVAEATARTFRMDRPAATYELGGPHVYTYRELIGTLSRHVGSGTLLLPMPFAAWQALAFAAERLPNPPLTHNQVELMQIDNVASGDMPGFSALGIMPRSLEAVLPSIQPPG